MEASTGAGPAAPAAAPPASPAAATASPLVRSPAKAAASPRPTSSLKHALPARCPACGALPLTQEEVQIVRKPGRRSTRDAQDPRNRTENLVTREFLLKHIVAAQMSLRDIGSFHGYTISTLSRRAKQEAVPVGARARSAAEAASAGQPADLEQQQQGAAPAKAAQRRKPSASSRSKKKSLAAEEDDEVEEGSEAEGGVRPWPPAKRQRRATAPARKPSPATSPGGTAPLGPAPQLLQALPPGLALPLPRMGMLQLVPADAQQLQYWQLAQQAHSQAAAEQAKAQQAAHEMFAHAMAQTVPPPPVVLPAARPQAEGSTAHDAAHANGGQEHEADTDEEDVAELLGLLRHRSPARTSDTAAAAGIPAEPAPAAAAAPAAPAGEAPSAAQPAAASAAEQQQQQQEQQEEQPPSPQPQQQQEQQPPSPPQPPQQQQPEGQEVKQEQQLGLAGEPQAAAAPSEQQAATAVLKPEGPPAEQQGVPAAPQRQQAAAPAASNSKAAAATPDATLAPSTAPIDELALDLTCSQPGSFVGGCGTQPGSPTAASQQQPAGSQLGPADGQASQAQDVQQPAEAGQLGSQPDAPAEAAQLGSQPDAPAGSLSPQMAAVKASTAQLSLQRAVEAFQAADIDSAVSMLLPLRRLQRAGKGGAPLQQVVARWDEFSLPRQQDLFSAALLHALEGRWDALEADLTLELAAG